MYVVYINGCDSDDITFYIDRDKAEAKYAETEVDESTPGRYLLEVEEGIGFGISTSTPTPDGRGGWNDDAFYGAKIIECQTIDGEEEMGGEDGN